MDAPEVLFQSGPNDVLRDTEPVSAGAAGIINKEALVDCSCRSLLVDGHGEAGRKTLTGQEKCDTNAMLHILPQPERPSLCSTGIETRLKPAVRPLSMRAVREAEHL